MLTDFPEVLLLLPSLCVFDEIRKFVRGRQLTLNRFITSTVTITTTPATETVTSYGCKPTSIARDSPVAPRDVNLALDKRAVPKPSVLKSYYPGTASLSSACSCLKIPTRYFSWFRDATRVPLIQCSTSRILKTKTATKQTEKQTVTAAEVHISIAFEQQWLIGS
jgi:hypothetical protein